MNDIVATAFAVLILYFVFRFAFGGPSSHPQQHGPGHAPPSPGTANAPPLTAPAGPKGASSSASKQTLISRFNLESRIQQQQQQQQQGYGSTAATSAASATTVTEAEQSASSASPSAKGKGKISDEEWKNGADRRREDLRRRKEEMILEARKYVVALVAPPKE